jgi:hypothetical protein
LFQGRSTKHVSIDSESYSRSVILEVRSSFGMHCSKFIISGRKMRFWWNFYIMASCHDVFATIAGQPCFLLIGTCTIPSSIAVDCLTSFAPQPCTLHHTIEEEMSSPCTHVDLISRNLFECNRVQQCIIPNSIPVGSAHTTVCSMCHVQIVSLACRIQSFAVRTSMPIGSARIALCSMCGVHFCFDGLQMQFCERSVRCTEIAWRRFREIPWWRQGPFHPRFTYPITYST